MYPCCFSSRMISDNISNKRCHGSEFDGENIGTLTSDTLSLAQLTTVEKQVIQIYRLHYQDIQVGLFLNIFFPV